MSNINVRRVIAYFIDMVIISMLLGIITSIPNINPYQKKYQETYSKLNETYELYIDKKIKADEYVDTVAKMQYKIDKYSVVYMCINLILVFGYYVLFAYYNKGQTIGKKIMKIAIKSNSSSNLTIKNYIIRAFIIDSGGALLFNIMLVFLLNSSNYYNISTIVQFIFSIIIYVSLFMIFIRKDNRGLQDLLANTKVLDESDTTKN